MPWYMMSQRLLQNGRRKCTPGKQILQRQILLTQRSKVCVISCITWDLALIPPPALTQATICLQLAKDNAQALRDGVQVVLHNEVSPSVLIASGLDLEEQQ